MTFALSLNFPEVTASLFFMNILIIRHIENWLISSHWLVLAEVIGIFDVRIQEITPTC